MSAGYASDLQGNQRTGSVAGDGLRISYVEWGAHHNSASPLLLLHGLTSRAEHWASVAQRLAAHRRVIALDARGHGSSDWATDAAYSVDAHFADVARSLDALGVARCVLVGYSMGGSVAILTAGALPERITHLVVVDAYPAPEMTPGSRRIAERVAEGYGSGPTGRWRGQAPHRGNPRPLFDPAIARRMAEELAKGEAWRQDLWPLWEAIQCPALVVRGALSEVLPEHVAAEMVARQPQARLITIPGVAHAIPFAKPVELAELIEQFVEESHRLY